MNKIIIEGTVDSMDVVNPFLLILRARNMAGTVSCGEKSFFFIFVV